MEEKNFFEEENCEKKAGELAASEQIHENLPEGSGIQRDYVNSFVGGVILLPFRRG